MNPSPLKTLILTVGTILGIMLIASCQEEQKEQNRLDPETDVKMARLMAVKNAELKKEIEWLKQQHEREVNEQQAMLDNCQQQKAALEKLTNKEIREQVDSVLVTVMDQAARLRQENENLKVQIESLKAELEQLKTKSSE